MHLTDRIEARVRALREHQLFRHTRPPAGVDLSSNDYLGLARHPRIKARLKAAVDIEGCGSTGSRLLRGEREIFLELERRFASFKGAERSLFFSSGYLANLAVLSTFPETGDVILSDAANHASLIDGIRLAGARRVVFRHNDVGEVARLLREHQGAGQVFLVTESLFSMDGDVARLVDYAELCRSTGALLVVDEAHAVGIYGADGSGLLEEVGVPHTEVVSVNPAGKALGVGGAFVAGPASLIEYLIQRARPFIFSTATPPALAAALDESLTLVSEDPARRIRLRERARFVRERLKEAGLAITSGASQIVPVILGANERALEAAEFMRTAGFDVRAIRPPTVPEGTARLRVSVNVGLSDDTIASFVDALAEAVRTGERVTRVR